jgi:hypothetical protein
MEQYRIEEELIPVYRIVFPDGSKSIAYNKTRATEFLRRLQNGEKEDTIRIGYDISG